MTTEADIPKRQPLRSTWIGTATLRWLRSSDPSGPSALIHKGGTRSGKTYNACIAWAIYLHETPGERLSITRATNPALKATVWHDMREVLRRMGLYDQERHNKTDQIYTFENEAVIDYFPSDDQKAHGRGRDHLWCNETNEITLDEFDQLNWRTRQRVMLDFNPSFDPDHWINERYKGNPNALWYTSTYEDNPHLPAEQVRKIEAIKEQDEWKWKVYGLGEAARPSTAIFRDVVPLSEWPHATGGALGLDFGYNDPMSLNRVQQKDREGKPDLDVWCLLHESHLTTDDLIERLPALGVGKDELIVCDSAEPDRIEKIRREGYNAVPAKKGKGSVKTGIDLMKPHRIRVGGPAGHRARQEFQKYRWKRHRGTDRILDEPAEGNDHAPDAVRYALTELLLGAEKPKRARQRSYI